MQVKNFSGQVILAKIFQKPHPTFCYFLIIFLWKKAILLHLNKLESSSPKDALGQDWLKLVNPVVLEKSKL